MSDKLNDSKKPNSARLDPEALQGNLPFVVGQRFRARRVELGLSQSEVSERADLHPAYIGQVERGEKNATINSVEKICAALELPMEDLFANLSSVNSQNEIAQKCYGLIVNQPVRDQRILYEILVAAIKLKNL